jgi:hypothetical protein
MPVVKWWTRAIPLGDPDYPVGAPKQWFEVELTDLEFVELRRMYREAAKLAPGDPIRTEFIMAVVTIMELKCLFGARMLTKAEQAQRSNIEIVVPKAKRVAAETPVQTTFMPPEGTSSMFPIPEKVRRRLGYVEQDNVSTGGSLPSPDENRIGKFSDPSASGAPVTQRKSAILTYPRSGTYRRGVLDAIARARDAGATDEELYAATGWDENTVRPRRNELMNDGWVEDSGRTRRTPSGKDAVVWVLSEQGRAEWRPEQGKAATA